MALATATIDFCALRANLARVKSLAPDSQVMAVLKANAYGHGLVPIAQQLADADAFAVARIEEALALRTGGITKPIVLLEGFFKASDIEIMLANNFQTVVHDEYQLEALEQAQLAGAIKVWLKVDTGMHRLGINPESINTFYRRLKDCPYVQDEVNLMTHFACADDNQDAYNEAQLQLFQTLVADKPEPLCLANSAAIINYPQSHGDWVRPGLMMYGVSPVKNTFSAQLQLTPVMTLSSEVIAVRPVRQGEPVGYGGHWRADKDTYLAVVAIGYGDGYPRHAQNGTPVLINAQRYPLVGRVSMDMITVDIGPDPSAVAVGDEAIMWGRELAIEEIAACADTIAYELLCNITPRVSYQYIASS
ncbi:alanine racemase [Pseudoalteromonas ruthenica]|uniref:Alanine racemase n=1 Tax=Pseudoalteromonas ruthenica TaxID=151081 RepID=A0A0F4PRL5_9GAMM|nr:alanine racemase [Pseudoalteromonas ruthenica]KJY97774.1 alanine racemase [Pseudoalteromonas ruthenica]KJZ01801.1 alanine racemase [Pseudoalteromonas ruthenica]TMO89166.1 alanine racemase [Pseudoalteromonas ruthenica]TMO94800.1 alanine racemase [Pseudoalteromonas ruthenica]TMO99815.1 alanine racemase [Pseudoalteromonas ruthenica]